MSSQPRIPTEPLFTPALIEDPYPIYRRFRDQGEIHYVARGSGPGLWVVFSHAACCQLFRDARLTSKRTGSMLMVLPEDRRKDFASLAQMLGQWMLFLDPPEHSRLRKLLEKGFSAEAIEGLRLPVQRIVDDMLDAFENLSQVDLMAEFAHQLPVNVISGMMGIPQEMTDTFRAWTDAVTKYIGNPTRTLEDAEVAQTAVLGLTDYFRRTVADRRKSRGNDLVSLLLQIEEDGEVLTEDELYAQCVMLLFAGHETTRNLLGNGVLTLLRHPKEAQTMKENLGDIRSAVEELLRFESPLQAITRVATEDFEAGQVHIKSGDLLMLMLGSANRDPKCFKEPDTLQLGRKNNSHLAFGVGRHFCIGNQLARLEAQVAIPRLFERFPRMRLATTEPRWISNFSFRGLESLRIALE